MGSKTNFMAKFYLTQLKTHRIRFQIAMLQGPDLNNEYSGCVAVDAIEFENCNLPEARENCNEDEFHCVNNKVLNKESY